MKLFIHVNLFWSGVNIQQSIAVANKESIPQNISDFLLEFTVAFSLKNDQNDFFFLKSFCFQN